MNGQIDFAAINALLDPRTLVPQWLPNGKRSGSREWVAPNPTRNDQTAGSFSVNLSTGAWADFATGDKGGDLVSLYAYVFCGKDQGKAAAELQQSHGLNITAEVREKAVADRAKVRDLDKPKVILAPPTRPTAFKHPRFGQPSRIFEYRSRKGELMMFVCRFDPEGMRKQIVPYTWCRHPDATERWTWRGPSGDDPRPLYGLDQLDAHPDAPVIIPEGEKAADAAQQMMGDAAACLAWLGGVETAGKVAVQALKGRDVILWPDADAQRYKDAHPLAGELMAFHEQPGVRAMLVLAKLLKGVAATVRMVGYTIDPDQSGWDLADAAEEGWTAETVLAHIAKHADTPEEVCRRAELPAAPAADDAEAIPEFTPLERDLSPYGFPRIGEKGAIVNCIENLEHLVTRYGIEVRYNSMKRETEIRVPNRDYGEDNREVGPIADIVSLCARNRVPRDNLMEYLRAIGDARRYHPVLEWIRSKPWDGRRRIPDLVATLQSPMDSWLKSQLVGRWLISAARALVSPSGFEAHGCLVLVGDQGVGKTTWVKRLAPEHLEAVKAGAIIDPANKDTVLSAASFWLVELGELGATFRKADVDRLKAHITLAVDKVRRPYDRVESKLPRRGVYFGSVNDHHYLVDETGNRRWWTIPVTGIDYQHSIDVQQLWAEVMVLVEAGEQHWLTPDEHEALGRLNDEHQAIDPVDELIRGGFNWGDIPLHAMTATEVLIAVGVDRPNRAQANFASQVLTKLTGSRSRKSNGRKVFDVPQKIGKGGHEGSPL